MDADLKNRDRPADIAKCIGIFSIIIGHFGIPSIVRVVFTFHVPVFYIITGYFLKKEEIIHFIKRKAKTLLVPYVITCASVVLLAGAAEAFRGGDAAAAVWYWLKAGMYGAGTSYHLPPSFPAIGAIWFLWASFWGSVFLQLCLRWRPAFQVIWVGCLFAFGYLTAHRVFWFPASIQAGCCAALYMYAGLCARHCDGRVRGWVRKARFLVFPVWAVFILSFTSFHLVRCDFGKGAADIFASICACCAVFMISEGLDRLGGRLACLMAFFGRNSLVILCVHLVEMDLVDWWAVVDRFQMIGIPRLAGCCAAVGMKMVTIFGGTLMVTGLGKMIRKKTESR